MKTLEKEKVVARKSRSVASLKPAAHSPAAPSPAVRPTVSVRARVVARPSRRSRVLADLLTRTVVFASVLGVTYFASTLGGYVVLERARQGARHGTERAAYARAEAQEARESIEVLTNPTTLRAWAETHGFVAGEATVTHGDALVAHR